jgi:hypothetical protein
MSRRAQRRRSIGGDDVDAEVPSRTGTWKVIVRDKLAAERPDASGRSQLVP